MSFLFEDFDIEVGIMLLGVVEAFEALGASFFQTSDAFLRLLRSIAQILKLSSQIEGRISSSSFVITLQYTTLFHQVKALLRPSSQYHIQISILSQSYPLLQEPTIAHPLSSTVPSQIQSKNILVQKV